SRPAPGGDHHHQQDRREQPRPAQRARRVPAARPLHGDRQGAAGLAARRGAEGLSRPGPARSADPEDHHLRPPARAGAGEGPRPGLRLRRRGVHAGHPVPGQPRAELQRPRGSRAGHLGAGLAGESRPGGRADERGDGDGGRAVAAAGAPGRGPGGAQRREPGPGPESEDPAMTRRTFLKGAAGVGLIAAGGPGIPCGRSSHAASDVVTVGINNDIVTWDPLSVSEWYTTAILPSVLETTVTNKDGTYIPWLLESIQPREATIWRMRLRPGIKFHDGEPLDAKALKWNLDLYPDKSANYPNPGSRVLLPLVKEVNVVDDRTVELVTTQASALVYEGLTRVYVMSPAYFQKVGRQAFGQTPVGTGAWRFKQWQRG